MTDKTWTVMNDLQEAFDQITTFSFLLDKLQEAVDAGDTQRIVDTTAALNAFYSPYCDNWDRKFKIAWNHVVTGEHLSTGGEQWACPPCEPCEPCDLFSPE